LRKAISGSRRNSRRISSGLGVGKAHLFYSIPNPHPPGEWVKRAASPVEHSSQLRAE
jgi:hypothetical protein